MSTVSQGLVPREDNASDHVLELLKPYTTENGGPLEVERVHFTPGRGNVIIKYKGQSVSLATSSPEDVFESKNFVYSSFKIPTTYTVYLVHFTCVPQRSIYQVPGTLYVRECSWFDRWSASLFFVRLSFLENFLRSVSSIYTAFYGSRKLRKK